MRRALRLPHRPVPTWHPPSTRARSNRAACTTSSATFWPAVSPALADANQAVLQWCEQVAGQRLRTAPSSRNRCCVSAKSSRRPYQPLPATPYEPSTWKHVKLHRDCYVVFETGLLLGALRPGRRASGCAPGLRTVELAWHSLPADRHSRPGDCAEPAPDLRSSTCRRPRCRVAAQPVALSGAGCRHRSGHVALIAALLAHRPGDRLRTAGRLLRLADRFTPERLETACAAAHRPMATATT